MDLYGKLKLKWSLGYSGGPLLFADDTTLLYARGNGLTFVDCNGSHVRSLISQGKGVGQIATCPKAGLLAYSEATLQPKIFVLKYPECDVQSVLEGKAQLEYVCLTFSADGKQIASLSGLPDFLLTVWDVGAHAELCSKAAGPGVGYQLSFSPLSWRQLCLLSSERAVLWTLEQCASQTLLTSLELVLPDRQVTVGSTLPPARPPGLRAKPSTLSQASKPKLERSQAEMKPEPHPPAPPTSSLTNMGSVLYKESYSDFLHKKDPVLLSAHCWSAQQGLYLGCSGGQLMVADTDTGIITVLANPELTQQGSGEEGEEEAQAAEGVGPQTAHALLTRDSLGCLLFGKRGLLTAGKDGVLCCFETSKELKLVERRELQGGPVSTLACSASRDRMAIGTQQGAIFLSDPLCLSSSSLISHHRCSRFIAIDSLAPTFDTCVTCREDGTVQVWSVEGGSLLSTLELATECCSMACPLTSGMVVVGTQSGHLYVLSLTRPSQPRLLMRRCMHSGPVKAIRFDQVGRLMASMTTQGPVFLYDARPSSRLSVLGYLDTRGDVLGLSLLSPGSGSEGRTQVVLLTAREDGTRSVTTAQVPTSITDEAPAECFEDATCKFSAKFVFQQEAVLPEPASCLVLAPGNTSFMLLDSNMQLAKISLPPQDEEESVDWELSVHHCYPAHQLSGGMLTLSFHHKWLASGAPDGSVLVRLVENPERTVCCTPHHYGSGGCSSVLFTRDGRHLLSIGDSIGLTCWSWELSSQGQAKGVVAAEHAQRCAALNEGLREKEDAALDGMSTEGEGEERECDTEGVEKTWLQLAVEKARKTEDDKYVEIKAQLRQDIRQLQEKVLGMIASNEGQPDMERLERHEFILDMEEHQRLQLEEEAQIDAVQEEIELGNLAKMFLREQIKRECWDDMSIKGKTVKAFCHELEVSNYAMKELRHAQARELERIKTLRQIEIAEEKIRAEVSAGLEQTFRRTEELGLDEENLGGEEGRMEEEEGEGEGEGEDALVGSHGAKYGGRSTLLISQFCLHSPVAKKHQIVLLEDCVRRIKLEFNRELDEVVRLKGAEIARIAEKNVRISKIIFQLKLTEELIQPSLGVAEEPERLLTVEDKEVTVEKHVSAEERKRLEEVARVEEQRRLAAMGDNPRERALDMMMGGRLEANVEEDLFKDMVAPEFLTKDPAEMSEEEIRLAREFQRKEAEFLEEREKLKRSLEAELRKLQDTIRHSMDQFDERLGRLFQLKIGTEMAVHQEELKMVRLTKALLVEEEVTIRAAQLHALLEEKKESKVQLSGCLSLARRQVEEARELYEHAATADRELDKGFKREFADCEVFVDQLYKLFRKRPRGQRLKAGAEAGLIPDPKLATHRPSSGVGGAPVKGAGPISGMGGAPAKGVVEDIMSELDQPSHAPEGVEPGVWERLVAARRHKVESELHARGLALQLAEMTAFLGRRQAEEEGLQQEIQDAFKALKKLQEDKMHFDLNLEIQLLLKQGQVEVTAGEFIPDFSDCVLIHRGSIEQLNSQIKHLGESKLSSMTECKDFKRGIHGLEWEHRRLRMEAEDLVEQARDIQKLRVTKELQSRLLEADVAGRDHQECLTLERTLELNHKMHRKNVRERGQQLSKLRREAELKREENHLLDEEIVELQVSILERQQIEKLAGAPPSEASAEQRMRSIVARRQLVGLAKRQAEEVAVLRAELERLRMRTFPALVQID